MSCLQACFCMGRYLCLEPVLPVAMRFHGSCSAVTSALASPVIKRTTTANGPVSRDFWKKRFFLELFHQRPIHLLRLQLSRESLPCYQWFCKKKSLKINEACRDDDRLRASTFTTWAQVLKFVVRTQTVGVTACKGELVATCVGVCREGRPWPQVQETSDLHPRTWQ